MRRLHSQARSHFFAVLSRGALLLFAGLASPTGSQTIADIPDIEPIPLELAASEGEPPLFLMVVINGRDTGLIGEFFQSEGYISSTRSELEEVGIRARGRGGDRVTLDSIDGLHYTFDEVRQVIEITAPPSVLVPHQISAQPATEPLESQSGFGAVLNYRLSGNFGDNVLEDGFQLRSIYAAVEGRIYAPFGVLTTTGSVSSSGQAGLVQVRRQDTHFVYSNPRRMLTFTLGDFASSSLPWARSVRMGGVQLQRDFSLRSDVITTPMLSYSGVAALPTTVDLYVDSVRRWSGETEPGPFVVQDLPFVTSRGEAVFVLRDESGREEEVRMSFFATRDLLRKGQFDFAMQTGRAREDYGLSNFAYGGDPIGTATLRYGLNDRLTVYGHLEAGAGVRGGSLGFSTVLFNRAEITVAAGASRYGEQDGQLKHFNLRTEIGGAEVRLSSTRTTSGYRDLAYATGAASLGAGTSVQDLRRLQPARAQDVLSVSFPLESAQFGLSLIHSDRNDSTGTIATISYSQPIGRSGGTFRMNGFKDIAEGGFGVTAAVSIPLGARSTGSVGLNRDRSGVHRATARVTRRLDTAPGSYGYAGELSADDEGFISGRASASYRSRYGTGEVSLRHASRSGRVGVGASVEGSVVVAGGGVFVSNPIRDAFAVVDVGVPNVPVMLHNRPVARTGASGKALVPNLQSNRSNRVSIDPVDLPLDLAVEATAMSVVPARRSGVVATMGRGAGSSALVLLRDAAGAFIVPGSRVMLNGETREFVVGYDGELWLEDLGTQNLLRVETAAGSCAASFVYEGRPGEIVTIDQVECL